MLAKFSNGKNLRRILAKGKLESETEDRPFYPDTLRPGLKDPV